MATDLERLVVQLSADTKQYQNALNRAMGITNRQARAVESRFKAMNTRIASSMTGMAGRIGAAFTAAFGAREMARLADTAIKIENSLKVTGLAGAELKRVYDSLRDSAMRNYAPLETLTTLYSRLGLAQKSLGVSVDEMLNFTDKVALALRVQGTTAEEARGALIQLSQAMGAGIVRAEEFNSIVEGAPSILRAAAAGLKEAGGEVSKLRKLVIDGQLSSQAFFRAFEAGAPILEDMVATANVTLSQALTNLNNALIDSAKEFNDATGAADRFAGGINNIAQAISDFDVSGFISKIQEAHGALDRFLDDLANSSYMEKFAEWITGTEITVGKPVAIETLQAGKDLSDLERQIKILEDRINANKEMAIDTTEAEGRLNSLIAKANALRAAMQTGIVDTQAIDNAINRMVPFNPIGPLPQATKQVSIEDFPVTDDKKKKAKRAKASPKTADDRFDNMTQQIQDRIAAMRIEAEVAGLVYQEQERRRMALELEQEALKFVREEARKKGDQDWQNAKLTPDQISKINEMSEAYAQQAEALRQIEEAQGRAESAAQEFYDTFKSGMIGALKGAESFSDALSKILEKLADMVLNSAFDSLFNGATGSGGWLTGIFKGFGFSSGGYTGPGPKNKPAGVVHAGEVVWSQDDVRKAGGVAAVEAMRKGIGGMAMPAAIQAPVMPKLSNMGGGGGTINAPVNINIDATGADREGLMRVEQQVAKLRQEVPSMVISNVRKAQKSNVKLG